MDRMDNHDLGFQHNQIEAPEGENYLVVQVRLASGGHPECITGRGPGNGKIDFIQLKSYLDVSGDLSPCLRLSLGSERAQDLTECSKFMYQLHCIVAV